MKTASYFETKRRENGESFVTFSDSAPDWLKEAVQEAHGDRLPNDWVFEHCREACRLFDAGEADDIFDHCDSAVDIYTRTLFGWLANFCLSSIFAEAEETARENGVAVNASLEEQVRAIQFYVIESIVRTIVQACEENAEQE